MDMMSVKVSSSSMTAGSTSSSSRLVRKVTALEYELFSALRAKLADAPIRTVYGLGYQWAVD